jgi:outer-membrane receptor for ferric coprogen and ferric-rhodotorulic acid
MLRSRVGTRLSTVVGSRWSNFKSRFRVAEPAVPTDWTTDAEAEMEFTAHAGAVVDVTGELSLYGSYSEIFVVQTAKSADGRVLEPRVGGQWEVGA